MKIRILTLRNGMFGDFFSVPTTQIQVAFSIGYNRQLEPRTQGSTIGDPIGTVHQGPTVKYLPISHQG